MRIVNTGNIFRVYDNSMQTFNSLPKQCYTVKFDKQTGFFLETYSDIVIGEKIYGVHQEKVDKVLNAFALFQRNLGVILSGDKGIGKSLCAKMLAQQSIEKGYPVIVINTYFPGIADYLTTIEQEVVILFDEFDKTFSNGNSNRDSMNDPQTEMLTLFDGISQGKKLFIVTCNELTNLNNYLVNRPGRFHYHFRFDYPTADEIREYLQDKIDREYYGEIDKVIVFSRKVSLNYDCLRAIAFELALGASFEVAIKDLNIVNMSTSEYNLTLVFEDGMKAVNRRIYLDMFDDNEVSAELTDENGYDFYVHFIPSNNEYDYKTYATVIKGEDLTIDWCERWVDMDDEKEKAAYELRKARVPVQLIIRRKLSKNLHYAV